MAAASAPKTETDKTKCGARTRSGSKCKRRAGAGTDHVGTGQCKHHGGSTRNGKIHAAREQALRLGAELQMEPHEALLLTVRRAAMWERFCAGKVSALEDDDLVVAHQRERTVVSGEGDSYVETSTAAELNLWLREHQRALDQLARLAKCALDAGVEERRVRIAEQFGDVVGTFIRQVLDDLKLSPAQKKLAPAVVRGHLELLEGGKAAA